MSYSVGSESFFFLSLIIKLTTIATNETQTIAKMTIIKTPLFQLAFKSSGLYMIVLFLVVGSKTSTSASHNT